MKTKLFIFSVLFFTSIVTSQVTRIKDNDNIPAPRAIIVSEPSVVFDDVDVDMPFAVLDEIPQFLTCKDTLGQEAKKCFNETLNNFIVDNLKYPKKARKQKIEGKIFFLFVIDKSGLVTNIRTRNLIKTEDVELKELMEKEALRVINLLPKFKPAKFKGRLVNVSYAIPIVFVLEEK